MTTPRARRRLGWLGALALLGIVSLALQLSAASGTPAATVQGAGTGQELFGANCAVCHGPSGAGTRTAPALGGVVDRLGPDGVEATIRDGRGGMPAFGDRLSDGQIAALADHLDALTPEAAAPGEGRRHRPMREGMWEHMPWDGMMTGWGWLVMLLWVLFSVALLVLLVLAMVWLARNLGSNREQRSSAPPSAAGSAREALDLRYARGEIGREEYLRARQDLEGPST